MLLNCVRVATLLLLVIGLASPAVAVEQNAVDALLAECRQSLATNQDKSVLALEKLRALRPTFTEAQNEAFHNCSVNSLGIRGLQEERVALAQSFLGQIQKPALRAKFLYHLVDGNTVLGRYDKALQAMNESILLLPLLDVPRDKMTVLQAAVNLSTSLHAYDEALDYADRIYSLRDSRIASYTACIGLANKVEINFIGGNREVANSLVDEAVQACDTTDNHFFALIVKTDAAVDLIDAGQYSIGIHASLPLLQEFSALSLGSDYVTQLNEALARAYFRTGNNARAEHFGLRAYKSAQTGGSLLLQEKSSETMAGIKRAQGELADAIEYYDANLKLNKRVLNDQLQKDLAYQRAKFDSQDKANQLKLLEQANKILSVEKDRQGEKYENLILMMTLSLVVLALLAAWFVKTLNQKNIFRHSAQVDGLTQVHSRGHFLACARHLFSHTNGPISLVLFDMDFFKHINDTFGHSTGDWVLKKVCDTVRAQLRKTDVLGRLGGEEFAICLALSTEQEVHALAERCRTSIEAIDTSPSGSSFTLSASFGIATRAAGGSLGFDEALVAADKALYVSKNNGRNQVTVFQASAGHDVPQ